MWFRFEFLKSGPTVNLISRADDGAARYEREEMSDSKKYYYMRLKENFFDSSVMIALQSRKDGCIYSDILLKMYCRSLPMNGKLMITENVPMDIEMIASVTRHSASEVRCALKAFQELGLIEILDDGGIYMLNIQSYIGKSSTEADRVREFRNRIENDKSRTNVQRLSEKRTPEIEKETEIKKEKEVREKDSDPQFFIDNNSLAQQFHDPEMAEQFSRWLSVRSQLGPFPYGSITEAISQARRAEEKYGAEPCIKLIKTSIASGWKSIPWDRLEKKEEQPKKKNSFNNFKQNEYDYEALERMLNAN